MTLAHAALAPLVLIASAGPFHEAAVDPELRRIADRDPDRELVATVRLPGDPAARSTVRAALAAHGVRPRMGPRGPVRLGRLDVVEATARTLARAAAAAGAEVFMDPPVEALAVGPSDPSGMASASAHGPVPLAGPRGRGVRIAAMDTGVDIYHPHFFAADGGAYPWVDVDGDGVLTPGVDAVDTDLDGLISDDERLILLDYGARFARSFEDIDYEAPDGALQPATDYLFADFDDDGIRGYGPAYGEATPGWGEPLFVPDDADGDGTITLDERVLLLRTSKIAAVSDGARMLRRGVDLATWGRTTAAEEDHGTAVLGILVGGQDLLFRRHRGLVPDAEVLLFDRLAEAPIAAGVAWARDEGARVILHEYASYWVELDGTSSLDTVVDEATAEGLVNVCGTGNAGAARKHSRGVAGESPHIVTAEVPAQYLDFPVQWLWITTHWRDAAVALDCALVTPRGTVMPLVPNTPTPFDGGEVTLSITTTTAGTRIVRAQLASPEGVDLAGTWQLACEHDAAPDTTVLAVLRDLASTGVASVVEGDDPRSSLGSPGTADTCITVGAAHFDDRDRRPGGLADYSSRGPRIDDGRTVDLVTPGDPIGPYPSTDSAAVGLEPPLAQNNYRRFIGTSAAIPHAGAAIAALLEVEPDLTPAQVRERLRERASVDERVGDEDHWGRGRLDARALVYGEPATTPPEFVDVALTVDFVATDEGCVATLALDPAGGDDATARWDDDYDGAWDTEFVPGAARELAIPVAALELAVRVEIGRGGWRVGGAALAAVAPASCFVEPGDDGGEVSDEHTGSSGTDSDTGSTGDGPRADDGGGGCGCATEAGPGRNLVAPWLLLVALGRRRRARGAA